MIDGALEPEVYLKITYDRGWKITGVLETHVHADHFSRSKTLAEQSEAPLYLPEQDRVSFSFTPIRDSDVLEVGAAKLKAIHTPGHTMESTSYLLDELALFTGDTLFTAAVGRPDLGADSEDAQIRAKALYNSLQRLLTFPPES